MRQLFSILREQRLFVNLKKCDFYADRIIFLGYVVTKDGIEMDRSKIEAITNWPTPSSIHDVRSFFFFFFWISKNLFPKRAMPQQTRTIQETNASRANEKGHNLP